MYNTKIEISIEIFCCVVLGISIFWVNCAFYNLNFEEGIDRVLS